jgi:DNA-binding NarL/FixJ family response regulator
MIRILVVDDHPVVREGLVSGLGDAPDFEIVGAVGSAEEAVALAGTLRPEVVLLDLELPGTSGVDAIPRLLQAHPSVKVLVLTAYDTEERVMGSIRAGARGYVLKGASLEEIGRAIRAIASGGSYLEPRVASRVISGMGRRSALLSPRERQVLRLVAEGLSTKQIARKLAITERTVKFHVASILNKLGADNRAQAVAVATQRGLL